MKLLANPEVVRRLAAVAGLFVAIILFMNPVSHVLKVELADFAARHKFEFSKLPLDQYIAQKTKGRLKEVGGPKWQAVMEGLLSQRKGQTPEEWMDYQPRRLKGSDREFYFGAEQEPFAEVAPKIGRRIYLAYKFDGETNYILLHPRRPKFAKDASNKVIYPLRAYAWLPLIIGLALYFFLPKVKKPADSLGYRKLWGLVFSDFLGLAFAGAPIVFSLALTLEEGRGLASLFDIEKGWIWLTLSMWLLTGFGLFIMSIGVWYRNLWVTFTPTGIERHTYKGCSIFAYDDVKKASLRTKKHHWLLAGLLLFGGGNPAAAGQAAMLAGQNHVGIGIDMKNGESLWIRLEAFENPQKLVRNLKDNGVELDNNLDPTQTN